MYYLLSEKAVAFVRGAVAKSKLFRVVESAKVKEQINNNDKLTPIYFYIVKYNGFLIKHRIIVNVYLE